MSRQLVCVLKLISRARIKGFVGVPNRPPNMILLQSLTLYDVYNKYAQSNLGTGPHRSESLPRSGLITTAKVPGGRRRVHYAAPPASHTALSLHGSPTPRRRAVLRIDQAPRLLLGLKIGEQTPKTFPFPCTMWTPI